MAVRVGTQITAIPGGWDPPATSFAYQWQSSPDGVTWDDLAGETRSDHVVATAERGSYLRCEVTATSMGGAATAVYTDAVQAIGAMFAPVRRS